MCCPTLPNYRIRQAFVFVGVIGRRRSDTEGGDNGYDVEQVGKIWVKYEHRCGKVAENVVSLQIIM